MTVTPANVLLYVPNLIGYGRIIFTLTSLILMTLAPSQWIISIALYVASFVGDLFDGMAARKYNQTSTFGGLMDMVTDRCSTTGLLCVLVMEFAQKRSFVLVSDGIAVKQFYLYFNEPNAIH
jgi:CDP-diacylglycerol--inositol 3-phosphatidyltransferase